jgi:hypothetical protein
MSSDHSGYAIRGSKSTGHAPMSEWTQADGGARLMMLVLYDNAKREYAYGPVEYSRNELIHF